MARTASHEYWGDCIVEDALDDDYRLRLPYGPGGCRFYYLGYAISIFSVFTPDARNLQPGGEPQFVIACTQDDFEVYNATGTELLATLTKFDCVRLWLLDNSTEAGTWAVEFSGGYEAGSDIPSGRVFYDLRVDVNTLDYNVLNRVVALGYDGVTPAVVRCTVAANKTIGSTSTSVYAFDTGGFPTGSLVHITLEAGSVITGIGGAGGRGADVVGLPAQAGGPGGHAMRLQDDAVLVNYGKIQGGGGGGGGGAALSSPVGSQQSGGGGGAGAGYQNGVAQSGDPGDPARASGYGGRGSRDEGGLGGSGYVAGGDGGGPGQVGSSSTALGGSAGLAINRNSGRTLTKIVAGTITGTEATY